MKIRFIYSDDSPCIQREKVITKICESIAHLLELPDNIEIELRKMGLSIYGETVLDPRFNKRIKINCNLSVRELIQPIIHELIHLHQVHTGKLSIRRDGSYVWEGKIYPASRPDKIQYKDYMSLPWEQDVTDRQHILLEKILNSI